MTPYPGMTFILTGLYLTFLVSLVMALLEPEWKQRLPLRIGRKWGKFLLGLVILGVVVQVLTFMA